MSDSVILDMDGVLVNSYRAHFESWLEMAAAEGIRFTEAEFQETFGRTSRETIAKLWGKDLGPERIGAMDRQKERAFRRIIAADFPVMPGAVTLLESLRAAGFRLAVGSSAPPENVEMVLEHLGDAPVGDCPDFRSTKMGLSPWSGRFDAVVTGADVKRGKPDPQVFLLAAERLGASPERCVVVEDAPVGIAAAHAAGMAAIGLASTGRTRESLAAADLVVDRLDELSPEVFRGLIVKSRR